VRPDLSPLRRSLNVFVLFLFPGFLSAQTVVTGKVTDSRSGDPIPFANVIFQGTTIGTTTDFDGNYSVRTHDPVDSLVVSYLGYQTRVKAVERGKKQTMNFQLEEEVTALQEVVFEAGENPAYEVLRQVVRNKATNDKRKLSAYEYDTYTKIEIDVDNMSDRFRQRKVIQKITQVLDSVEQIAGEDGKPVLPIFISESVSKFHYRTNPRLQVERILKSKVNGLGIEDGTLITQFVGASFQEYNFYQNWLTILTKEFVSPIADGWRLYYQYDLTDSVYIDGHYCYRLDFFPRRPQDLAFSGTMWITKNEWALKQIDAQVAGQANLNFVEKIRIQQSLVPTDAGAWIPEKNRVLIDISELSNTSAGMLAKFYTSNRNIVVNQPRPPAFYEREIVMEEDARINEDETYWDTLRHEPLSETEKNVYRMIDTLQQIPVVRTYTDLVKIAVNGYYTMGKVNVGPYISLIALNNVEGLRLQPGFRTNYAFSRRWVLGGSLGYGFNDERFKYSALVRNILSRDRWTTLTLSARRDLGRVGVDDEVLGDNYLFLAAQRFGTFRRPYYYDESRVDFQRELVRGLNQRVAFRYNTFRPVFDFGYRNPVGESDTARTYENAELVIETRFARDELFVINDNERLSLGTSRWPAITLRYTHGFRGLGGSDFDYDKVRLTVHKRVRYGPMGVGYLTLTGEYVFDQLPYPLLSLHLGNRTPFFAHVTYNLMDYGEFVSDRYATMHYSHHFEGFLLNSLPLLRKLKWRLVGTSNVIFGGMSTMNRALVADEGDDQAIGFLSRGKPYVEVGYGVENIFRFFRVDFIHRLTYLDKDRNPDVRRFGVLFSFQFSL
jgi:hypothetical protein